MDDFIAGAILTVLMCVCVALFFNFKAVGSMQEDCQRENNVYQCVMKYVPAESVK